MSMKIEIKPTMPGNKADVTKAGKVSAASGTYGNGGSTFDKAIQSLRKQHSEGGAKHDKEGY